MAAKGRDFDSSVEVEGRKMDAPERVKEAPRHGLSRSARSSSPDDGSNGNDSEPGSDSEADRREVDKRKKFAKAKLQAEKDLRQAEMLHQARQHFHRRAGNIYVHDEHWLRLWHASGPCHLYVSLNTIDKVKQNISGHDLKDNLEDIKKKATSMLEGHSQDLDVPQNVLMDLPPRIKIVNRLLRDDMRTICGEIGPNHVAPFRGIVPFEEQLHNRCSELERLFSDMEKAQPEHEAVLRQDLDWLPREFAVNLLYATMEPERTEYDEVSRTRILRDGYRALVNFLDIDLGVLLESRRRIKTDPGTVKRLPFLYLWYLFEPGQEIITNSPKLQAYRVLQVTGGRRLMRRKNQTEDVQGKSTISSLAIDCFHLDFDGLWFGPVPVTITIKPYDGWRLITQIGTYPLVFDTHSTFSKKLTERGKKFEQLAQASHRRYNGLTLRGFEPFDNIEEIDGDVMVDFKLAYRSNEPSRRIGIPEFGHGVIETPTKEDDRETTEDYEWEVEGGTGLVYEEGTSIKKRWLRWVQQTDLLEQRFQGGLTMECYRLLPPRVWGYVFLRRRWYPLDIDVIEPLQKASPGVNDGFEKLVLPPGHKDIVRALVKTHARKLEGGGQTSDTLQRGFDVVRGKGKGLIILLHGAPGVGKSSTAECVAANAGKPLFPITVGDVGGETAQEVEHNLERYFDLARQWNCVLLLDEADVFLSTRLAGNLKQNSLVSVFLRALEYYSGILILTTNRVGSFDEAIKSRVHCALYYPPLDKDQTINVWRMNLDLIEERNATIDARQRIQFNRKEIEEFAQQQWKKSKRSNRWNGRQIKNAFQTAVSLADWDTLVYTDGLGNPNGTVLKVDHFQKVAVTSEHFDMYMERTRRSDYQRALENEARDDTIGYNLLSRPNISESDSESGSESESYAKAKRKGKSSKKSSTKKSKSVKSKKSKTKKHVSESESEQESPEVSDSKGETD